MKIILADVYFFFSLLLSAVKLIFLRSVLLAGRVCVNTATVVRVSFQQRIFYPAGGMSASQERQCIE
jgi:hypothetical protein